MFPRFRDVSKRKLAKQGILLVFCFNYLYLYLYTWQLPKDVKQDETYYYPHHLDEQKQHLPIKKSIRQKSEQTDWQNVSGSAYLFFTVYSAYAFLPRNIPDVILIGVTKTFNSERLRCVFHLSKNDSIKRVIPPNELQTKGSITTMRENWNRPYSGVFIRCMMPACFEDHGIKPEMVSILPPFAKDSVEPYSNRVKIQYKYEPEDFPPEYKFNFSVCVLPTYKFNEGFRLIEWLEFYKLMGVEQFTFYNVSIGPDASCILDELLNGGDPSIRVNVHPWHHNPVKTFGQIRGNCAECSLSAGGNDCVYRHRGRDSKYMVFVDLDEYLMPRTDIVKNYPQLISQIDAENPTRKLAQYQFKNSFFALSRPSDPELLDRCYVYKGSPLEYQVCQGSLMMNKVTKEKEYMRYNRRSKYIIKPEGVKEAGNHFVYAFELGMGFTTARVSEKLAYLRHYRMWGDAKKNKTATEVDRLSLSFGMELVESISKKVEYYRKTCKIKMANDTPS